METEGNNDWYSVNEALQILDISRKTLYDWILNAFLILSYLQIIRGRGNILVYSHRLMVRPTVFFQ